MVTGPIEQRDGPRVHVARARQSLPSRIIALRMTRSLRMQATMMTLGFLPRRRSAKAAMIGLKRMAVMAAIVIVGGEADEGGDGAPRQATKLWQEGDQRCGEHRPDAGNGAQPPGESPPVFMLVDEGGDHFVELGKLLPQGGFAGGEPGAQSLVGEVLELVGAVGDPVVEPAAIGEML